MINEKILLFLTGREQTTTTEIASLLHKDYYQTRYTLQSMEKNGLVTSVKKGRATYWEKA